MSILKSPPKQPKAVTIQARVEESVKAQLERYAEFIDASPSYVITEALKLLFRKDDDFRRWTDQHTNNHNNEKAKGDVLAKAVLANMKLRPTQFGVRENTASPRQHAPRTIDSSSSSSETLPRGSQHGQSTPVLASRAFERCESANTKPLDVATGGDRGSGEVFSAPATVSAVNESRHAFEPLVGCEDAAKLLGNIHVKTLQRYARTGTFLDTALPATGIFAHPNWTRGCDLG